MKFSLPPKLKLEQKEEKEDINNVTSSPKYEEKPEEALKGSYGNIKDDANYNIQDLKFKKYFSCADRTCDMMKLFFCGCCGAQFNSTSDLIKAKKPANRFPRERHQGKIMKLAINCTGLLELDDKVIHPFVKIHFIDIATGKYLAKSKIDESVINNKENTTVIQYSNPGLLVRNIESDFVPPFATRYCDFRVTGENRAEFYEGFWVNEDIERIYSENTVIIFELLDYNVDLLLNNNPYLRENMYPIAWAYLRPLGEALVHTSTKRLQFYRYKFIPTPNFYKDTGADIRTPLIYFDFNWPTHDEYNSFLEVDISFVDPPARERVQRPSLNAFEEEIGVRFLEAEAKAKPQAKLKAEIIAEEQPEAKDIRLREKLISWERGFGQPCLIPNKLMYKFESDDMGCFALKFSNKGRYLAAACSATEKRCLIKILNVETGAVTGVIGQHQGIVHEFKWSITDDLLVSVSNDTLVKVWIVGNIDSGIGLVEDYTENEQKFLLGVIQHPSYVYSIEFLPEYANKLRINPVIATACFDGKVRIWILTIDEDSQKAMQSYCASEFSIDQLTPNLNESEHYLLSHNYPTSIVFDDTGRLYAGDSRGYIHVWDVIVSSSNKGIGATR